MIHITNNQKLAVINGKAYTLHQYYQHYSEGPFFIAVSGRTPLKPDDIDKHWIVKRHGHTYISLSITQK